MQPIVNFKEIRKAKHGDKVPVNAHFIGFSEDKFVTYEIPVFDEKSYNESIEYWKDKAVKAEKIAEDWKSKYLDLKSKSGDTNCI